MNWAYIGLFALWVVISAGAWAWSRRLGRVMVDDRVREQRRLAVLLGTASEIHATVNTRLVPHPDVVDLAAVHGYAVVRHLPHDTDHTAYEFVLRAHYPPPCGMMAAQDPFHRGRATALRRAGGSR